ncbi:amidase [Kitasatospora sp. YST-16]|uniref:amidase n=1 Tax=Kitasatospora sp. YST-16 TaxID=2998080 RepID=UPI002283AC2A|nr:amidase [Kitasatospora sp. YST-16]WAL70462.1 amidase [Kitasatospora sp. YST-16]WNW36501.1 amidase [Streptomyces sp. Li-HN-5-13]
MTDETWTYATAGELTAALRAGKVSSVELTEEAIGRIEREDGALNAICAPDFERARDAARAADRARARGEERPLLGVPVTVKESYNVAGLPTTWGMPQFRDHVPAEDALQVARVKAAGAVVLGKTNVPLGLQDIQTYNEIHGTTVNPWDRTRTCGGSSGGSAAALAAGFGALSLGTDIAGSLRTPAHFCGVYAHKPTLHLLPTRGMVPPHAPALPADIDLAVAGPMARSARDLTLLLDVMAGPDPLTSGLAHTLDLPPARHDRLSDFRVLVLDEHPLIPTGADVRAGLARVVDALAEGGARIERHSPLLPDLADAAELYTLLLSSAVAVQFPVGSQQQLAAQVAGLSEDDHSLVAARLRGLLLSHRDWLGADRRRELHRHAWRQLFAEFDAVVAPITPTAAFPHDQDPDLMNRRITVDGTAHTYFDQLVWAGLATMPGLPATAVPTGPSAAGLPVGVQLIGPMYEDRTPLRLAELLEERLGGFRPPRALH